MHSPQKPETLTPWLLSDAPELGLLKIANVVLDMLCLALVAEHPTLIADDDPKARDDPPSLRRARSLIASIVTAEKRMRRYEQAVRSALEPSSPSDPPDGMPF